jgi:hypothetical protein
MSTIYLLRKYAKPVELFAHTYSPKLRDKYKANGWQHIATIHGWNCSIDWNPR